MKAKSLFSSSQRSLGVPNALMKTKTPAPEDLTASTTLTPTLNPSVPENKFDLGSLQRTKSTRDYDKISSLSEKTEQNSIYSSRSALSKAVTPTSDRLQPPAGGRDSNSILSFTLNILIIFNRPVFRRSNNDYNEEHDAP